MFFENVPPNRIKSTKKAMKVNHGFLLVALLIHSLYFLFTSGEFNASFWILMSGYLIQLVSEFIYRKQAGGSDD